MARIELVKKELIALRIVNRCSFLEKKWEKEWMANAIKASFRWAERHSKEIDSHAPFAIVKERGGNLQTD